MGSKIGPPGTPDFPGGARGAGKFPGARGAEFPPSGRGVPGPRIWGFPRDRGETRKMGQNVYNTLIWIWEGGKFALRRGNFADFWKIGENPPAGAEIPDFPAPPKNPEISRGRFLEGVETRKSTLFGDV